MILAPAAVTIAHNETHLVTCYALNVKRARVTLKMARNIGYINQIEFTDSCIFAPVPLKERSNQFKYLKN